VPRTTFSDSETPETPEPAAEPTPEPPAEL
jgi:hypothetical protein